MRKNEKADSSCQELIENIDKAFFLCEGTKKPMILYRTVSNSVLKHYYKIEEVGIDKGFASMSTRGAKGTKQVNVAGQKIYLK